MPGRVTKEFRGNGPNTSSGCSFGGSWLVLSRDKPRFCFQFFTIQTSQFERCFMRFPVLVRNLLPFPTSEFKQWVHNQFHLSWIFEEAGISSFTSLPCRHFWGELYQVDPARSDSQRGQRNDNEPLPSRMQCCCRRKLYFLHPWKVRTRHGDKLYPCRAFFFWTEVASFTK